MPPFSFAPCVRMASDSHGASPIRAAVRLSRCRRVPLSPSEDKKEVHHQGAERLMVYLAVLISSGLCRPSLIPDTKNMIPQWARDVKPLPLGHKTTVLSLCAQHGENSAIPSVRP